MQKQNAGIHHITAIGRQSSRECGFLCWSIGNAYGEENR